MARGDYRILETGGSNVVGITRWNVDDRTTTSLTRVTYSGEPMKQSSVGSQFAIPLLDGDPEIGTDYFIGICQTDSTETSSADGFVNIYHVVPMMTVMAAKATTSTNADTDSEINALIGDDVAGDVSSLVYTIDENEGDDDNVHGFVIIGGNSTTKELYFTVKPLASVWGSNN